MRWDAVHDARAAFLACLWALSHPGTSQGPLPAPGLDDDARLDGAAAVLLALLDADLALATVGGRHVAAVAERVRKATGAGDAPLDVADFVLVDPGTAPGPVAAVARRGTALAPEAGATVVYCASGSVAVVLDGPGLVAPTRVLLPLPPGELDALLASRTQPPLGVDALVVGPDGHVVGLPRSTHLRVEAVV